MITMKKWIHIFWLSLSLASFSYTCYAQERLYRNEFSLSEVKLLEGPFKHARDLNIQTLLQYKVDRLLAPYLKEAGLTPKDSGYKNWDGLAGHVGGHYLSALAMNVAATNNAECKKRMLYMIAELKACQEANAINNKDWGVGYVGGVPNSKPIWSTLKHGDFTAFHKAWVPWYNVHKMYAGLRDAWLYTGNEEAKTIFLKFCDWGINITAALTDEQMQSMLDTEQGGMNEVFADAYQMTGVEKYLTAAKRFSHRMLLDPMSKGIDNLDDKHANTQVPKAIGFERIGELSQDNTYEDAGKFFWQTVVTNRTLAFGGNSRREFFPNPAECIDFVNDVQGPESCNSYNMLKLTEDLFRTDPSVKYIDYYERTLYNHILSTQNPETGGYVYFTPVRPNSYRVYSTPNEAMWCCVGSGMENHSKYNEFIYTHQRDSLFLNLFIASELNWKEKGIKLTQQTQFPFEEQTKLMINDGASHFTLMVRYPSWVADASLKIIVNGKSISYKAHPSSYIAIDRQWKKRDVVQIILPMHNEIERLPNVPDYIAILHGPILLGAKTGTEDMKGLFADDSRWAHIPSGEKLPVDKAPILIEDDKSKIANQLVAVKGKPLNFTVPNLKMINPINVILEPFYQIHDARYMMYWMALTNDEYHSYTDSMEKTLKDVYKNAFLIGTTVTPTITSGQDKVTQDIVINEFNAITPENVMKAAVINPQPGVYNYGPADDYVAFGEKHHMFIMGHTLVWHNQCPDWFFTNAKGEPNTKEEQIERLRSHIQAVAGRYAGRVNAWDVVNEVIDNDGSYRNTSWVKSVGNGDTLVKYAFMFAAKYAPNTELYYNDFNAWRPEKRDGIVRMIKMLQKEGIRIDGVGIQGHWGLDYPKTKYIEDAIDAYAACGVKVMITELDVDVLPLTKEGQIIGQGMADKQFQLEEFKTFLDPYPNGLPDSMQTILANRYAELFKIFYNRRDKITRVTLWGVHDGMSWKNGYPIPNRTNYPLLWDRQKKPKPALKAVLDVPGKN